MAKLNQSLEMFQGETKKISFTIIDDAGDPVDLTDSNAIWVLARTQSTTKIMITKTIIGAGIEIESIDDGEVPPVLVTSKYNVFLTPSDTTDLLGNYYQELRMTDSEGSSSVVATGTIVIKASLTA